MTDNQPTRPRDWPKKWVKEEKFWQDIFTRSISGLIVVFFGVVGAAALGFADNKGHVKVLVALGTFIFLLPVDLYFGVKYLPRLFDTTLDGSSGLRRESMKVFGIALCFAMALFAVLFPVVITLGITVFVYGWFD